MIDLNVIIPKYGYEVEDKPEFAIVRNYIISNGFSVKNFDRNLKTLVIMESPLSSRLKGEDKAYIVPEYNTLTNSIKGRAKGANFIHELLHMASNILNDRKEVGAMYADGTGQSLNEAIADYLTLLLADDKTPSYPIEILFFEFFNQMYPDKSKEVIGKFFLGKPDELYDLYGEDKELILSAVRELDKFTRDNSKNSILDYKNDTNGEYVPQEKINEELTNAFSIILNHFIKKDEMYAEDLIDDFEDMMFDYFGKKIANNIIELLHSKLNRGRKL